MNLNRNVLNTARKLLTVTAIVAAVLRLATYWLEIEANTGFFRKSGTLCTVYNVIGFVVFGLALVFSMKKTKESVKPTPVFQPTETALIAEEEEASVSILPESERLSEFPRKIARWNSFSEAFFSLLPGFGFLCYSLAFVFAGLHRESYHLLFTVLSTLSGDYFLFSAIGNSERKNKFRAFFALAPAFWCTMRMVVEYRDLTRFINKSLYVGQFLFILSAMIFFVYQAQLLLDEKAMLCPNAVAFSALSVVFFGFTTRLPQLIAVFGDKVTVDLIDTAGILIDLSITLYAVTKIHSLAEN